jgi:hypothetical protein
VQASVDLDASSRVELSDPQATAKSGGGGDDADSSSPSGIIEWIKANWKLTAAGVVVILLLVIGAWYST